MVYVYVVNVYAVDSVEMVRAVQEVLHVCNIMFKLTIVQEGSDT